MRQKEKIISIVLCFSIVFFSVFAINVKPAKAWPVSIAIGNLIPEALTAGTGFADLALKIVNEIKDNISNLLVIAAKVVALKAVNVITKAIIGGGEAKGGVISDWGNYLYTSPQQTALARMNSFFTTMSKGRASSLNYEGVSTQKSYDNYLINVSKESISGSISVTNLQEIAPDPQHLFASNNLKGLSAYMSCANNPACYSIMAQGKLSSEIAKEKTIADKKQTNGFLPAMKNGIITKPAAMIQAGFTEMDKMGTDLIMKADYGTSGYAAFGQIAAGAAISVASRTLDYAATGKNTNKSTAYPFSVGYNTKNGVNAKAGGQTYSSGPALTNNNGYNPDVQD